MVEPTGCFEEMHYLLLRWGLSLLWVRYAYDRRLRSPLHGGSAMTTCEELDVLHSSAAHTAVQLATEMIREVNGRASRKEIRRLGDDLDRVIVGFSSHLHALLLSEGLRRRIVYEPGATQYGDKEVMRLWLGTRYLTQHLIVIAVHPKHHTLIYYNGPPFMGTTSELIESLHDAHRRELARERCSACHYINTELWVCGMGRVLDTECSDYVGATV